MKSWLETRWRGTEYFEELRQKAIPILRDALARRDEAWEYDPQMFDPFELLFHHIDPPYAIAIQSGAWRSRRQRRIEGNMRAYAGRSGFMLLQLYAEDIIENADAALDRVI